MTHRDVQAGFIGKLLQFQFPEPDSRAVAPARVWVKGPGKTRYQLLSARGQGVKKADRRDQYSSRLDSTENGTIQYVPISETFDTLIS
jgi:hypothetical protein